MHLATACLGGSIDEKRLRIIGTMKVLTAGLAIDIEINTRVHCLKFEEGRDRTCQ